LTAAMLDAAKRVLGIAVRCKNLKGTYMKVLREAAAVMKAGATLAGKRMVTGQGEYGEILEEMRGENQRLRNSQEEMRKEI
ncbi:hypothetical protein EAI_11249, partial [Harpegnathos saltator]